MDRGVRVGEGVVFKPGVKRLVPTGIEEDPNWVFLKKGAYGRNTLFGDHIFVGRKDLSFLGQFQLLFNPFLRDFGARARVH